MKKIFWVALLAIVSACSGGSQQFDREAIHAKVVLASSVSATCVLFEVRDATTHAVLEKKWLPRTDDDLQIAVFKGALPGTVELAARPYRDGTCDSGQEARTPNGPFEATTATFVTGKVTEASVLELKAGVDGDNDGYVGPGAGGADCNDGSNGVHPGVQEACTDQVDLNCDSRKGCEASSCSPQACVGPPAAVALALPTSPVTAGTCLGGGMVQVLDATGTETRVSAETSISLQVSPASSVAFYADAACATPVTGVTLAANTGSASFFIQGQVAGNVTVTASGPGLTASSKALEIRPGTGNRLVFSSPARTVAAGVCSAVVQLQSRDAQSNASPVAIATDIALTASPDTGFKFYSDAGCATEVTRVTLAANASDASFYFKGTKAGGVSVTVTAPGFTGGSQSQTITPGAPAIVAFGAPQTTQAGSCLPLSVGLQDAYNNPTTQGTSRTVNLSTGGSTLAIYSNSTCSSTTSSVSISANTNSKEFYVRSTVANSYTVTGTSSPLTGGSVGVTVTAGPATGLAFTTPVQSSVQAGSCSAVATVQLRDTHNNPVSVTTDTPVGLSVSSSPGFEFFAGAGCTGAAVSAVTLPANSNSASFSFKGSKAGGVTLTATASGFTANQAATIVAAPPSAMVFTTPARTVVAGVCATVSLQLRDGLDNPSNASSATPVGLQANPAEGFIFYSNSGCSTIVNEVSVPSSQNSVSFYFKGTKVGTSTLTISSAGLGSTNQSATITPSAPTKLVFTTPARAAKAGACSAVVTVQSADVFDNVSAVAAAEEVSLSQSGSPSDSNFNFYSDASCTALISSNKVSIPASQSTASFYFRGEKARTATVTADGASFPVVTQNQTVTGGNATGLKFSASTPPGTWLAGTCTLRTVEGVDGFTNPSTNALTLNLSATPPVEFFSDSSCTVPVSQVSIADGASAGSFYFKGVKGGLNATEPHVLTVASSGLTSVTQTENIIPTVRSGSCTIATNGSGVDCSFGSAPSLANLDKTFLVFQATNADTTSTHANVRCFLNTTSEVRCERANKNAGVVNILWSAAEFPSGVAVQRKALPCVLDGSTTTVSLSAVNLDRTFLLLSSEREANNQGSAVPRLAVLTSTTEAEIRKTTTCIATENDENHLQAVDYTGATVQRGLNSLANGTASKTVDLSPSVDLNRSILLYSYITDGSDPKICNRALRGELTHGGSKITFSRGEGDTTNCVGSQLTSIAYEVVQFPVGTVVQQLTQQLTGTSATLTLPTAVDPSRTVVFAGGQWASGQALGEGRYAAGELLGEMRARAALNAAGTTVTLTRETSNASATFTIYAVQLKP